MRILFESSRKRLGLVILLMVITISLAGTLLVRYHIVNAAQNSRVIEQRVSYGTEYVLEDIVYVIDVPSVKKVFDEDYKEEVYHYTIPIKVRNQSQKEMSIFDIISNICVFSAGEPWYGNVEKTDEEIIKCGQEVEFLIGIDVLINRELVESVYKEYTLYNIVNKGDIIKKVEYHQ